MTSTVPFRLTNLAGGPVHVYELESGDENTKSAVYRRSDGQKVKWDDEFGWSARDEKSGELAMLIWGIPASQQGDKPSEGTWVGKRGPNCFTYDMKFGVSAADKKAHAQRLRQAIGGVEM